MARSVPMWVGRDDDQTPPQRVRDRVYDRFGGRCHKCTRLIGTSETWTCEHVIAITNGGANSEANLNLTCCNCLPAKNAEDAAIKRKNTQVRYAHRGISQPSSLPGARIKYSRARGVWIDRLTGEIVEPT